MLRRRGEEILGLLVSNGHVFEKKGKNLLINDWRLLVAEGILAFPQSWHTPTANTLQIRKQGPRRSLPSAEGHTAKLTWEAFRTPTPALPLTWRPSPAWILGGGLPTHVRELTACLMSISIQSHSALCKLKRLLP